VIFNFIQPTIYNKLLKFMKKIIAVLFTFSILGNAVLAQNADFKNNINVHLGASLFSVFNADLGKQTAVTDSVKFTSAGLSNIPTIGVSWDYGISKSFSIGIAGSYSQAKVTANDLEVFNKNTLKHDKLGNFAITVPRTTFAARFLLHYANKGRIDCYSGLRLGVGLWSVKLAADLDKDVLARVIDGVEDKLNLPADQKLPPFITDKIKAKVPFIAPQVQLIIFGLRGYVTNNIGLNFELAAGSPYVLAVGANYRF
jgi:hypothetical protein